ncbi:hypothetical protein GCK32_018239 [Trichostrongylus colubriformis]|uniref:VWFA domain-containing protein n=1 Tax=Trichostrongylus colubriformis TaxID=6319 RepID=A0AAN8IJ06_TRICO
MIEKNTTRLLGQPNILVTEKLILPCVILLSDFTTKSRCTELLQADDSKRKVVVVLSDGESSNCAGGERTGKIYRDPDPWEFGIAEKWRKNGVLIIYIEVASVRTYTNSIKEIVGQKENQIVRIKDLNDLTEEVVQKVIQKICCGFKL